MNDVATIEGRWLYIPDFDIAFDSEDESFEDALEKLGKIAPSAFVKVYRAHGGGGGWPRCEAIVNEADIDAFCEFFSMDEEGKADLIEEVRILRGPAPGAVF